MRTKSIPALALLLAACGGFTPAPATPSGPVVPPGHFIRRAGGSNAFDALVSSNEITGSEVSLTLYRDASDHALRGNVFAFPVDVAVSENKASGLVGPGPLDVTTERHEDKLHVSGMIRGAPTNFDVSDQIIDGKIGPCDYHLTRQGAEYHGSRGCNGGGPVQVEVPAALRSWSDAEFGAALGLLLSFP